MNKTKIAVYGTLRKGYGNHRLMQNTSFIGKGKTVNKYKLTASGIPYVNPNEPISNITVEVYDVNDDQLASIDALEGYNPNNHEGSWYKRTPIDIELDNGEKIEASIYFGDRDGATLIQSGDYNDYR